MDIQSYFWLWFIVIVIIMLIIDLWFFNKKAHEIKIKEAVIWSIVWITLAMIFNLLIYICFWYERSLEFLTWYVIEKSLSIDNLFVFIIIFSYFKVKKEHEHKILFWWILWALIFRAIFIFAWITLIENFHFIIYIFWAFLIFTWIKILFEDKEEIKFEEKFFIKLIKKIIPISKNMEDWKFCTIENGKKMATPLILTLVVIEFTDIIFAVDSIPAILAISNDIFVIYTSNIFAILWLRSLYFALSWIMSKFEYLKYWLSWILSFVWIKMLISWYYKFPILLSLLIILWFLIASILIPYLIKKVK